jgi:uncharacterized protein YyaL (SSP411 family)
MFLTNPWNTMGAIMDANTFSDPRVVGVARERFVPVRVDVDRRPDVEERFGAGGPPSVAILMPSGESLYLKTPKGNYMRAAGTYMTADEMYHFLLSVADYYRSNRQLLDLRIADIVDRFKKSETVTSTPLDASVLDRVASALREQFDRAHAGFGLAPKGPDAQALTLCWYLVRLRADAEARDMGLRTARAIWDSPLHDTIDGGVFRIAIERDWSAPRYEKSLDVNARLLEALAEGAMATGEGWLTGAVREQADFILNTFSHPQAGFMRAQGAGDAQGTYFRMSRRERRKAQPPPIEPTRIVSWNAHTASALLRAYQALGDERYRERAVQTLDFLLNQCQQGSRGMAHFFDGSALMGGLLVDQVAVARALLDAHQVTGKARYLMSALEQVSVIRSFFRDPVSPRYVDRINDPRTSGAMSRPDRDLIDNSELALVLLDLSALTGSSAYAEEARLILETFVDRVQVYGVYASPLARAVDRALRAPLRAALWTGDKPEVARALARAAVALPQPWVIVDWVEGRARGGTPVEGEDALRAESGAAAVVVGQERRSEILRTPQQVQAVGRTWAPPPMQPRGGASRRAPARTAEPSPPAGRSRPDGAEPSPQSRPAQSPPQSTPAFDPGSP